MTRSAHWDRIFDQEIKSAWIMNPLVEEAIYVRMTGQTKHWLPWVFENYLEGRPKKLLSVGCGDGAHELVIARNGYADYIEAFDASEAGIEKARHAAKREDLRITFNHETFENYIRSAGSNDFDVVLFSGSLHHVENLEGMLSKVKSILKPSGKLILNEYVGACYNIYPDEQVALINEVVDSISPEFKIAPDARWVNPSIDSVLFRDPSESVRSSLILQFTKFYFEFEFLRSVGGGLLHPIFDLLKPQKINDGSHESDALVRMLIRIDELLYKNNILPSDFAFGVCRPRG